MSNFETTATKILRWEGGFSDDPDDHGGITKMGITLTTLIELGHDKDGDGDIDREDLRLLSAEDFREVLRGNYWDRWRADEIRNDAVAAMLVDWLWCSGRWGIVIPQRLLGVTPDGIVGPVTIGKVNEVHPGRFLTQLGNSRLAFIRDIVRREHTQKKFEKGWTRRVIDFMGE